MPQWAVDSKKVAQVAADQMNFRQEFNVLKAERDKLQKDLDTEVNRNVTPPGSMSSIEDHFPGLVPQNENGNDPSGKSQPLSEDQRFAKVMDTINKP